MNVLETMRSTLGTYSDSDVRSLLHADHLRIRELSKDLAEATSALHRKNILHELKPLLIAHSRSEESAVYKRLMSLRSSPDSRIAGSEGMVEHNLADIVLERLANAEETSSDIWKAHAKVLREALEHHIEEEENTAFRELGEHFSDEERDAIGAEFSRGKKKLLTPTTATRTTGRKRASPTPA